MAPLDIGSQDFAIADARVARLRRERAQSALTAAIETFGRDQREQYERCAATEEEIGDTVAALVGVGELCVRQAEELKDALKGVKLGLFQPQSTRWLASVIAEAAVDQSLERGVGLEIVLRAIELETVS